MPVRIERCGPQAFRRQVRQSGLTAQPRGQQAFDQRLQRRLATQGAGQGSDFEFAARQSLADFALRARMPVMFPSPEPVEAGGLASYSPRHTDLWERAATYVDRILKGARPADLPIEQPTRFELLLNLKTARALGLTISASLLLRAQTID